MQSLQDKASEWSGVAPADAFAIDEVNVFEALGGTPQPFVDLSTNFYTRVYEDEEQWFREIFSGSRKEDAIQNQYEFLVQRMGGPPLFSQRRAPKCPCFHCPIAIEAGAYVEIDVLSRNAYLLPNRFRVWK
uniref:Uncharacterized protein n=1 Tax=Aegilops tauschii TaxID=37682 RepID=M8CG59_AEGTA